MNNDNNSGALIALVVAVIVAWFMLAHFYVDHRATINAIWITFNRGLLFPWTLFFSQAAMVHQKLGLADPVKFTPGQLLAQTSLAGSYWRWIVVPGIAYGAYLVYIRASRIRSFVRQHNMRSLLDDQGKVFPAVRPVAVRKRSILDEPLDTGPWRVARTPVQFVAENRLMLRKVDDKTVKVDPRKLILPNGLVNMESEFWLGADSLQRRQELCLDTEGAARVFAAQIGPTFSGWAEEPGYVQALAACFLLYAAGRKDDGKKWIDRMNLSFAEGAKEPVDARGALEVIAGAGKSQALNSAVDLHGNYRNVLMMALLVQARKKAMLPPSQFLWLRPTDRSLWYALHQMGGRMPWVEAAAAWSHFYAEEQIGKAVAVPHVAEAVTGLQAALNDEGWFGVADKNDVVSPDADAPPPPPPREQTGGKFRRANG